MPFTKQVLNSRVARRIVLLFILAAVVPLGVMAGLTLYRVSDELIEQSARHAREEAKSLGMTIYGRLQFLNEELNLIARQVRYANKRDVATVDLKGLPAIERIKGLFQLSPNGKLTWLHGTISEQGPQLLRAIEEQQIPGKSLLLIFASASPSIPPRLYLLIPLDPRHPNGALFGAQLNTENLWDVEEIEERSELICVLSEKGTPLYCNHQAHPSWLTKVAKQAAQMNSGRFAWQGPEEKHITAFWSIFLAPHYQLEKWTVAIGIPEQQALAPVHKFQTLFPRVVLFAILLVIVLSIPVIRNILRPLEKILAATRRLSDGRFDTRVTLNSKDEFQEIGESFNQMAAQLGHLFDHQGLLTDISRQLQQADSIDGVFRLTLDRLRTMTEVALTGAICIEKRAGQLFMVSYPLSSSNMPGLDREVGFIERPEMPASFWSGTGMDMEKWYPILRALESKSDTQINLVPACKNKQTLALLAIATNDGKQVSSETQAFLEQLADILAIALTNIFLDNKLRYQAHHDPLTGLDNRILLKKKVKNAIEEDGPNGKYIAIIIFDVDRLKEVNDTQGHAAGDELLMQISNRIRRCFRPQDTVSRFSGDEFIIVIRDMDASVAQEYTQQAIDRIEGVFAQDFTIGNWNIKATVSKGVAFYPQDGETFQELIKNADAAMHYAKAEKPGNSEFFSKSLQASLNKRLEMERALSEAVERGEFVLHYQPIMDIQRQLVVGVEALVRWARPDHGLVMPDNFIAIAEEMGIIDEIGTWVLNQACSDCSRWFEQGVDIGLMSVNVSGRQLQDEGFVLIVNNALETSGMHAHHLELEITETALIEDFEQSVEILHEIRALGVRVAVDDFGTGYSSLKYLKVLPVDRLKIDRLFVRELPENKRDVAIISSLVNLSQDLGFSLLAEGVETQQQADFLLGLSINIIQGFLYSVPLAETDLLVFVKEQNAKGTLLKIC